MERTSAIEPILFEKEMIYNPATNRNEQCLEVRIYTQVFKKDNQTDSPLCENSTDEEENN